MTPPPVPSSPYESPTFALQPPGSFAGAFPDFSQDSPENIRRAHLGHENNLKAFGWLYLLGGFFFLLAFCAAVVTVLGAKSSSLLAEIGRMGLFLALGILQLWVGSGLRALRQSRFIPATVLAVLKLPAFPVGTLVGIAALVCLHSAKGRFVMSDAYRDIIARTPQVKAKTSPVVVVVLLAILAVLALIIGFFLYLSFQNANR